MFETILSVHALKRNFAGSQNMPGGRTEWKDLKASEEHGGPSHPQAFHEESDSLRAWQAR